MIVDSYAHAWAIWPYDSWPTNATVPDPDSRARIEQLLLEMDRHQVDKAVIACARIDFNPDNNEYVAAEAARHPDRIVQFADVDSEWSPEFHTAGAATRLREAAERWNLSGFFHALSEQNDGWLRSDEGRAFFETAAELNLIALIGMGPVWLEDLVELAEAYPTLPFQFAHQAGVRAEDGLDSSNLKALVAAARQPNLSIKISGFYYGSHAMWDFPYHDQIAVFQQIYEAFGAHRLTWGSDFPVSPWAASTYAQTLEVVRQHCTFIRPDDLPWIMGDTMEALLQTRRPVVR